MFLLSVLYTLVISNEMKISLFLLIDYYIKYAYICTSFLKIIFKNT